MGEEETDWGGALLFGFIILLMTGVCIMGLVRASTIVEAIVSIGGPMLIVGVMYLGCRPMKADDDWYKKK